MFGIGKKSTSKKEPDQSDKEKGKAKTEPTDSELIEQLDQLQKTTEEIEAEKEEKKFAREEKKFLKKIAQKRKQQERFIAPILLIITIIISFLIWMR